MKGITHQDIELTYRLMPCAAKVVFSDIIPYLYMYHPNSTSKSMIPENKIKLNILKMISISLILSVG